MRKALLAALVLLGLTGCRPGDTGGWLEVFERRPGRAVYHLRHQHPQMWARMHRPQPGRLDGRCSEWSDEALAAGWSVDQWPTLDRVMYAESNCTPGATSPAGAKGLMQIMPFWAAHCGGWPDRLYEPSFNLRCALVVLREQGWYAWDVY